ncbi:Fic family protein [Eubacterium aggregans]|uniref:Fic family protein n=1 Tax=Eubacterium aggregans TaxID=81409 RepID=UPI003F356549
MMARKTSIEMLKQYVNQHFGLLNQDTLNDIEADFNLRFSHDTTKIEGNTFSLGEAKTFLIDGYTIAGKTLREHLELINSQKAFNFVKKLVENQALLSEEMIKDIHEQLMTGIFPGGLYRNSNARITGASFIPCDWTEVRNEMKFFMSDYEDRKKEMDSITLAAWVHAEFVKIHPFPDGNGRTARLLLNFILMNNKFLPITIKPEKRAAYYDSLDIYGSSQNLEPFSTYIEGLEKNRLLMYKGEIQKQMKNLGLEDDYLGDDEWNEEI